MTTSGAPDSASTSKPSSTRTARIAGPRAPLGNRTTVGASLTATASRRDWRSVASSRGAAIRSPGTIWSMDMSHMPLWLAPSSPVMPARSSTKVTPARCRAQSMSTWSKARLRNVAYSATTG